MRPHQVSYTHVNRLGELGDTGFRRVSAAGNEDEKSKRSAHYRMRGLSCQLTPRQAASMPIITPPQRPAPVPHAERVQPRALAPGERQTILDELHSDRFADLAAAAV